MARRHQDVDDMFAQDVDSDSSYDIDDSSNVDVDSDSDSGWMDSDPLPTTRGSGSRQSESRSSTSRSSAPRPDVDVDVDSGFSVPARSRRQRAVDARELGMKPNVGFSVRKERSRATGQEVYRVLLNGRPIPTSANPEGRYALTYEGAVAMTFTLDPKTGAKIRPWDRR